MSREVVQLPMRRAPCAVRPLAVPSCDAAVPAAVRRLLGLRDAAATQGAHDAAVRAAVQGCAMALTTALAQTKTAIEQRLDQVSALATELGLAVAREVVGDALARGHVDPGPILRRCLERATLAGERAELRVAVAPADHALLTAQFAAAGDAQLVGVHLLADATLPRGVVKVDSGAGSLSYDPREVLERVCAELRKELAP
jgi:flagellar biosynthesis/type III secretory pathway protein FliH